MTSTPSINMLLYRELKGKRRPEILNNLIQKGANPTSLDTLVWAVETMNIPVLELLIEAGLDINSGLKSHTLCCPLIRAVQLQQKEMVEFLIQKGANIHQRDSNGNNAVHWAGKLATSTFLELLLQYNVPFDSVNNYGNTPLHDAIRSHSFLNARLLIQHEANLNCRNDKGETPMHWAAKRFPLTLLTTMVEKGGKLDIMTREGLTPLWWAVKEGNLESTAFLLQQGPVDFTHRDGKGNTLFTVNPFLEMQHLLREKMIQQEQEQLLKTNDRYFHSVAPKNRL